jgi:hypothetical protein
MPFKEIGMAGKRILIIVGDFVEDYELMVPFRLLGTKIQP